MSRMDLKEFSSRFSKRTKIDEKSVRKVLWAFAAAAREKIEQEDKVVLPGLGSFVRRAGKTPGTSHVIFKVKAVKAK